MAVYKVPQDVEADDKLIGPFSFRQFIYLIIVAISMAMAWGFSQIFIPLAIVPLPVIIFFAALALPLRKDQPMEAYLSAVVSFYFLKSRKRFWIPDGIYSFITIIPPKDADKILTKNLNEEEATQRLGYLADLVDTHGWAIRGTGVTGDTSISTDLYYETQQTTDMMDNTTPAAQAMVQQLQDKAAGQRQTAITGMQAAQAAAPEPTDPAKAKKTAPPITKDVDDPPPSKLPSVDNIRAKPADSVKQVSTQSNRDAIAYANALAEEAGDERGVPVATPTVEKAPSTSASTPDTGTMELTHQQADELSKQTDVSVQTLAQQASRVAEKNKVLRSGDEVTISLR